MNCFLLQTNAARLDVDRYLRERECVVWGCGRLGARIAPGDRALLWRAAGGTKSIAGVVGLATVIEAATERGHDAPELCRDPRLLWPKPRLLLRVDEARPDAPVPRAEIKRLPEMTRHPVVTANQGCAFTLTDEQAAAILDLWRRDP